MSAEKAEQAQRLLDDPVLNEAFAAVIKEQTDAWAKSPIEQTAQRENYYMIVVAIDRLRGKLGAMVDAAKFEAKRR